MTSDRPNLTAVPEELFDRVVSILEQARANVARSVNANMVMAYWLTGREIVLELQGGEERAEYGKRVVENLSARLTERYGKGFSVANLKNFRQFYQTYAERMCAIRYPSGRELMPAENRFLMCSAPARGFSPLLSWSHYRALMRVEDEKARAFYEHEAAECGWSKAQL